MDNATAGPDDETDMMKWTAMIMGPENSPYDGGVFNVELDFPSEYPFKPPKLKFTTKIYHPNIKSTGEICMEAINEGWSPTCNVRYVVRRRGQSWTCVLWRGLRGGGEGRPRRAGGEGRRVSCFVHHTHTYAFSPPSAHGLHHSGTSSTRSSPSSRTPTPRTPMRPRSVRR